MSQTNTPKTGGLIFKRADLQAILSEPDTLGIAFALYQPGVAADVDMQVLKVSEVNGALEGEVRSIAANRKKAAPSNFHYPATAVNEYVFPRLDQLQADGYYFGYLEKANLLSLFASEQSWTEVFVGGGQQSYPEHLLLVPQTDWFTTVIALRKSIPAESELNIINTGGANDTFPALSPGRTSVQDILTQAPELLDALQQAITTIIMDKDNDVISGLRLANGDTLTFASETDARYVQLNDEQQLIAVYTETQSLNPAESIAMGDRLPYFRWAISCPPQWTRAAQASMTENENLRLAVDKALSKA